MVVPLAIAGAVGLRVAFGAAARFGGAAVVQALKHPILTTATLGAAHAATDGWTTDKVVKPTANMVGEAGKFVGEGTVGMVKDMAGVGGEKPLAVDAGGVAVESEPAAPGALSGMFNQFAGKMENNAAWALAPALGVAALANGRGNLLQNGMQGAVIMAVVAFMVQIAENMGFKLPGIGNVFNAASGAAKQSPAATTELEAANRTGVSLAYASPDSGKSDLNKAFNASAAGAAPAPVIQPNPAPARQYVQPVPAL